jgi:twinkle protein
MSDGTYLPPSAYDISGASHWHNQADAVLTVHRDFDDNTTRVITRKIREQDLYGKIGEAKFKYNFATKRFESILDNTDDWSNINFND